MSPGVGRHFPKISGKFPQAGVKRRAAPATASTIASYTVDPNKSEDGTKTPLEGIQSGPSEQSMWGVCRSGLAAVAPFMRGRKFSSSQQGRHCSVPFVASGNRPDRADQGSDGRDVRFYPPDGCAVSWALDPLDPTSHIPQSSLRGVTHRFDC